MWGKSRNSCVLVCLVYITGESGESRMLTVTRARQKAQPTQPQHKHTLTHTHTHSETNADDAKTQTMVETIIFYADFHVKPSMHIFYLFNW